uniref:hypothetical protein n=1 Tax=Ideonella sp. A 288 TaxID=1962181 RepID=UPI0011856228
MAETLAPGVPPALRTPLRQRGGWVLLAGVIAAHLLGANELLADRFGWGEGRDGRSIARIEVAFVRELAPREPPPVEARPNAAVAARRHRCAATAGAWPRRASRPRGAGA